MNGLYEPDPILTERLQLRPFRLEDSERVTELAQDEAVSRFTIHIPNPYTLKDAVSWIAGHATAYLNNKSITFAIERQSDGALMGAIGLGLDNGNNKAEMGYWIGEAYRSNGYTTEAAQALVEYAFQELKLQKITARHFAANPASGRIMQKIGMVQEGVLRREFNKNGVWHDIVVYGLLNDSAA